MTQSELAAMCGINYRSLQDDEQGHKKFMSANGEGMEELKFCFV